jgi:hypothetical protein
VRGVELALGLVAAPPLAEVLEPGSGFTPPAGRSGQALAGTARSHTPVPDWQIENLKVRYNLKLLDE